jgi:hypothetical protein
LIEALLEAVFTIVVEVVKAARRHAFPDPLPDTGWTDGVEGAPQSLPSHPLWDHEIDGQPSSHIVPSSAVRTVRPEALEAEGQHVLSYGRPAKAIAIVVSLCWVGFFVAAIFAPTEDRVIGAALMLLLILPLPLEFFGVRIAFDESGIRTRSPWRPKRMIPWSAVTWVWYAPMSQWYVVETTGFGHLRLHDGLSGTDALLSELERRGVVVFRRPDGWPPLGH